MRQTVSSALGAARVVPGTMTGGSLTEPVTVATPTTLENAVDDAVEDVLRVPALLGLSPADLASRLAVPAQIEGTVRALVKDHGESTLLVDPDARSVFVAAASLEGKDYADRYARAKRAALDAAVSGGPP